MRIAAANTASLTPAAMNPVIGVGAPWYTSGAQAWNGAIASLNAKPTPTIATPISRIGLISIALKM